MDASLSLAHMMRDTALRTETIEIGNLQLYRPSCEVAALVDGVGRGTLVTNFAGIIVSRQVFDGGTPVLPGFAAESAFVF